MDNVVRDDDKNGPESRVLLWRVADSKIWMKPNEEQLELYVTFFEKSKLIRSSAN
jgi:hypothetical protein